MLFSSTTFGVSLINKATAKEAAQADLVSKTADLDGLIMTYNESKAPRGDKPVLVMVHGYTSNKGIWSKCAKFLKDDYHLIIPDMAGHGETPYDVDMNYSIPSQAAWLEKLMTHLNIEKAHIAGNSMGGFIAAYFSKYYPQRTLGSILLDPAGINSPERSELAAIFEDTGQNLFLSSEIKDYRRLMGLTVAKFPPMPGFLFKALAGMHISRRDSHDHIFNDFFDSDFLEDDLQHIKAPTLLVWGRKDEILNISAVPIWEAGLADCTTIIWDDIGHVPMFEAPQRTAEAMKSFLEEAKV